MTNYIAVENLKSNYYACSTFLLISINSEALASELLENLEEIFPRFS